MPLFIIYIFQNPGRARIFLILPFICASFAAKTQERILVNIPSPKMEVDYIWMNLRDIEFFEKNNYLVSFPEGNFIESLKRKARSKSLSETDYSNLELYIRDSVYERSTYEAGYEKIISQLAIINQMLEDIEELNLSWDFKDFDIYQVNLSIICFFN